MDARKRIRTMLATWVHSAGGRSAYMQNKCGANAVVRGERKGRCGTLKRCGGRGAHGGGLAGRSTRNQRKKITRSNV
jgi:hypothetical protein